MKSVVWLQSEWLQIRYPGQYGRLSDRNLVDWYIKTGGFIFFFDGLNEVDDATRNSVSLFLNQTRGANFFLLSSQVTYSPFGWMVELQMSYLSAANIRNLLKLGLPKGVLEGALREFTDEIYDLYKLPHDVDFLVQLLQRSSNARVPKSTIELYACVFGEVEKKWVSGGRSDFKGLLSKRAFQMVVGREPAINSSSFSVGADLAAPLLIEKLIVIRGSDYYFQHNLVRDYLASLWMGDRWREILSNKDTEVDWDWVETLKLLAESIGEPSDVHFFLTMLLARNRRLAAALFKWFESNRSKLIEEWARDFKVQFADRAMV